MQETHTFLPPYLDVEILSQTIRDVEDYLVKSEETLDLGLRARVIALLYDRFLQSGRKVDRKLVSAYLRMVV